MKILIIRLSSIGDIFHTFAAVQDLKTQIPDAEIDWLVDSSFPQVVELSPFVHKIISIPLRKWKQNKLTWWFNLIKFKKNLDTPDYDYIIDSQGLIKSAVLARFLFRGPVHGLDFKAAREWPAALFYNQRYYVNQNQVAVLRLRGLIAKIFNLTSDLSQVELIINSQRAELSYPHGHIFLLHGTSKDNKKWPLANWLELVNWLIAHSQEQIVLTYSNPQELAFAEQLVSAVNSPRITLVAKLPFAQLADVILRANLVIGVDTGFTHLANLVKRPTLAIYLHSKPAYVGVFASRIAHNFGGYKQQVAASELIKYICEQQLVKVRS